MNRPELSRKPGDEPSAVEETGSVNRGKAWQELKGRLTILRRELQNMPVSLIGSSCWAERIQEVEECQRKLARLNAPPSLLPPDGRTELIITGNTLHLYRKRNAQSRARVKVPKSDVGTN
jgi:hypothetical protein